VIQMTVGEKNVSDACLLLRGAIYTQSAGINGDAVVYDVRTDVLRSRRYTDRGAENAYFHSLVCPPETLRRLRPP
jgi:hypothetical protein